MNIILKNKILDELKKQYPDAPEIYEPGENEQPYMIDENLLICEMSRSICALGIINVEFTFREDDSESWTQVEFFSNKLQKTIIICYEAEEMFRDLDDLATALADYQEQAEELENKILILPEDKNQERETGIYSIRVIKAESKEDAINALENGEAEFSENAFLADAVMTYQELEERIINAKNLREKNL